MKWMVGCPIAAFLVLAAMGFARSRILTYEQVQEKVQLNVQRNIHRGDSPAKVSAWLNNEGWKPEQTARLSGKKWAEFLQMNPQQARKVSRIVEGQTPEVSAELISAVRFNLRFYFDDNSKLTHYTLERISTSL